MRFNHKSLVVSIMIVFLWLLYPSEGIKAVDRALVIKQYDVNAQIQSSGDMLVEEDIKFVFNGNYNGVTKQILLPEAAGIENISVSQEGKTYKKASSAEKGDSGVFTLENNPDNSCMIWIYTPSANTTRSFKISYTVKNACRKYMDTGELYWKFIGTENQTPMESVSVNITLPKGSLKKDIRIFAHGPLTGKSAIMDDSTVNLSINNLPAGRYVEARVLFPPGLISKAARTYNDEKLQSILDEEAALAEDANRQRQQARNEINNSPNSNTPGLRQRVTVSRYKSTKTGDLLGVLTALAALLFGARTKKKYGTEPKPDFDGKYYRELPGDYTPAVMSMLYYRNVSHRDITATLMNLIRKRHLKMDVINTEKKGFFGKKRERDYVITRLNNKKDKLLSHEEFLLNWLPEDFGDGITFTFKEMRNSIRRGTEARRFREKYYRWMQTAKEDSQDFDFWDDSGKKGTVRITVAIVLVILLAIGTTFITGMSQNGVVIFGGTIIGLYIVSFSFTKRTRYGSDQYARWKGFRNFLKDFGNIKEAVVPSLVLWEHYLVYAISLDIARRVLDQLRIIVPSEDMYSNTNMDMLTYLYISDMLHGHNDIFAQFEDISSAFTEITDSAISVAGSQNSSSGGDGGGFSGGGFGGGSFGGGGGDGGGGFGGF